jgi:2-polyprenyl-6-methoxyphenol hydroxylase-like FAD-dependent oxidoreductase
MGGFGGNTGVQDAHNLAWKLALVLKGLAGPDLLATYNAERQPIGELAMQQAYTR